MDAGKRLAGVTIDRVKCVGAAMCVSVDPDRFEIDHEGKARTIAASFDPALAEEAADLCPQGAIELVWEDAP